MLVPSDLMYGQKAVFSHFDQKMAKFGQNLVIFEISKLVSDLYMFLLQESQIWVKNVDTDKNYTVKSAISRICNNYPQNGPARCLISLLHKF